MPLRSPPGGFSQTITMRSGSPYGSGFNRHAVHETENRGVGPDPERQRQHRHDRESRTLPQHPRRVA